MAVATLVALAKPPAAADAAAQAEKLAATTPAPTRLRLAWRESVLRLRYRHAEEGKRGKARGSTTRRMSLHNTNVIYSIHH